MDSTHLKRGQTSTVETHVKRIRPASSVFPSGLETLPGVEVAADACTELLAFGNLMIFDNSLTLNDHTCSMLNALPPWVSVVTVCQHRAKRPGLLWGVYSVHTSISTRLHWPTAHNSKT